MGIFTKIINNIHIHNSSGISLNTGIIANQKNREEKKPIESIDYRAILGYCEPPNSQKLLDNKQTEKEKH